MADNEGKPKPRNAAKKSGVSPLISIVLPVYNGSRYLRESIESCLEQTYPSVEVIAVDDGSTDPEVGRILDAVSGRVRVLRLEHNGGLSRALNAGFHMARGEFLTWTSDDNAYQPNALMVMAEVLQQEDVDFAYAQSSVINDRGQTIGMIKPSLPYNLIYDNCIGPCFLYRRLVYEEIGDYDRNLKLVGDYDYWIRIAKRFRMHLLAKELYRFRCHDRALSTSEDDSTMMAMIDMVRKRHFPASALLAADGQRAYNRQDYLQARGLFLRALLRRPWLWNIYQPFAVSALTRSKADIKDRLAATPKKKT